MSPPGIAWRMQPGDGIRGAVWGKHKQVVSDLADESQSHRLRRQPEEGGIIIISTREMERTLPVTGGSYSVRSSHVGSDPGCR